MVPSRLPQPMRYIMWMIIHMMRLIHGLGK